MYTEALTLCLQTPGCLPPLIWGDFGIGKTTITQSLAAALDWDVEILRPAERGEGALGVVPIPSEDRSVLHYPLPDWAARLQGSAKPGLIFLDEVSSTPPALQPAIMGLALDGVIAGQRLPGHIKRCAAANPVDQAAGGWDLSPALANRFVHLSWPCPSAQNWVSWLMGQPDSGLALRLDLEGWEKEWGAAKALGAAFIRSHPACLHEEVQKVLGRTPPAFATPRSWEAALRLLASCRAAQREDLYPMLAQGCLGPAIALEGTEDNPGGSWLVWLKHNDLPDPEELLKDPTLFQHDPHRPDRTFAILYAVAEAALATVNGKKLTEKARVERWQKGWCVLDRALAMKLGKDVVLLSAQILVDRQRRPKAMPEAEGKRVVELLSQFIPLFRE